MGGNPGAAVHLLQAGGYRLSVDDDGPGIAEEQRETVLDRGSRLDEQVAGHGLGLGIVRDIVDAWGGRLSLDSSPSAACGCASTCPCLAVDGAQCGWYQACLV